ncbi:hypothetical protein PN36_10485 [Candidatus Thiomargarita nelsonii]|uniref:Uncharacterized protein n=1 Tax=Candidatus Thiomargarita nelsonii TaxID=1003181 RepID=A0A4E0QQV4_9GAMM|nr:hypothetical protein PN36_10485 [Candidatus Thiomargarita nelsonii]
MSLNSRTIAKILREHFTGEIPIIKNIYEHIEFMSSLKTELEKITGVEVSTGSSWDMRECHFSVKGEFSKYGDSFTIQFNQKNELIIDNYRDSATIYQIEQIYSFIDRLKLEPENIKGRRLKTEKINKLKKQAILAKMKEIAKEDQFDFYTTEYKTKLKMIVRVEGGKLLEIDIPYGKFQEILKDLRSFIMTVRELQKSGISFKLKPDSNDGYGWIRHTSVRNAP